MTNNVNNKKLANLIYAHVPMVAVYIIMMDESRKNIIYRRNFEDIAAFYMFNCIIDK